MRGGAGVRHAAVQRANAQGCNMRLRRGAVWDSAGAHCGTAQEHSAGVGRGVACGCARRAARD